ncbi:flagellar assembly peptidoglycan hydrolase FlgJ [Halomonas elongata]|uniref:flagellar assembly peptidoglycan hydrolase FlgJ n=1 Tax=Halomonas elongata TaxID=2746 RepID=UPI00186B7128|nr:flagellar assembly peptidoglycan hydrolase FlgJ [Halomonas elongata]MBW5800241.1 flagellar assembly peptidoglycan hydrolase FlgJ [Halomonas elongata]
MSLGSGQGVGESLAMDVQGLERLKHTARHAPQEGLESAAKKFEAMFVQMMMKSMRDAVPSSGLLDDRNTDFYTSMLDKQLSQHIAERGTGLAEQLFAQLGDRLDDARPRQGEDNAALIAGIPRGTPRPLEDALVPDEPDVDMPANFLDEVKTVSAGAGDTTVADDRPAHVRDFVERLSAPAQAASEASGVPAELILAQAALETGWGRHEIATRGGGNSHNLFGIKAGENWRGETAEITTHEVIDGERRAVRDRFRVYDSFEAAFTDYARLVGNNPRYAEVSDAATPEQAAHALQRGGYATDPAYADKLVAVMDSLGPLNGSRLAGR